MPMKNKKMYLSLLCVAVLALQVAAVSTNDWTVMSQGGSKMNYGLWKTCMKTGGITSITANVCIDLPPKASLDKNFKKNSLYAARVLAVLGPVLVAVALLNMYMKPLATKWNCALLLAGALASLVAMAVWAAEMMNPDKGGGGNPKGSPGYSFYLNLAGGVLGLVAAWVCYKQ